MANAPSTSSSAAAAAAAAAADPNPDAIRVHIAPHLLFIPAASTILGFISGLSTSASLASLQFTAENAHRQPRTVKGWYFYQKTKNYKVLWAGARGGIKKAGQLGGWTVAFVGLQEGLDAAVAAAGPSQIPGRSTLSGALSGATLALVMSKLYNLGRGTSRRTALGASLGALAGGLQDLKTELDRRKPELLEQSNLPS